ncbi:hypothetical protein E4U24_001276 [Claviceps purpurea]|nr:hypothetical protein E4U24_001276 [Claviceps purpurea]KAG6271751.1 hypothetical protein E4U47_002898 [Claviceps purpurea]KAG6310165.1 hypothetical protein E4U44_005841 [Claviceps purpurea]
MAGSLFHLLTILLVLAGHVLAQDTTPIEASSTFSIDATTTEANSIGVSTDVSSTSALITTTMTSPDTPYVDSVTSHDSQYPSSGNGTTTGVQSTRFPPTTSIPNAVRTNAGRRPSEPGLRKLSIVVGLATYGLILL